MGQKERPRAPYWSTAVMVAIARKTIDRGTPNAAHMMRCVRLHAGSPRQTPASRLWRHTPRRHGHSTYVLCPSAATGGGGGFTGCSARGHSSPPTADATVPAGMLRISHSHAFLPQGTQAHKETRQRRADKEGAAAAHSKKRKEKRPPAPPRAIPTRRPLTRPPHSQQAEMTATRRSTPRGRQHHMSPPRPPPPWCLPLPTGHAFPHKPDVSFRPPPPPHHPDTQLAPPPPPSPGRHS